VTLFRTAGGAIYVKTVVTIAFFILLTLSQSCFPFFLFLSAIAGSYDFNMAVSSFSNIRSDGKILMTLLSSPLLFRIQF